MSEYILILVAALAVLIGFFLGKYIARLTLQNKQNALNLQINQLQLQLAEAKKTADLQLQFTKQQHTVYKTNIDQQLHTITREREEIRREKDFLQTELTRRNSEYQNLQHQHHEQKKDITKLQEKFTLEFENLANKILDEKSTKFTEQNTKNIKNILSPL